MGATHFSGAVSSTSGFSGALTGNVTGNITGNVTGNITGNVTGNITGNVVSSSVNIGSGGAITYVKKAAVSVDLASIGTLAVVEATVTVTGAAAGDAVIATPPATLAAGLMVCGAYVSAADTVKLRVYNSTGGSIDEAAADWVFTLIR